MKCPGCGETLSKGKKACENCGTVIQTEVEETANRNEVNSFLPDDLTYEKYLAKNGKNGLLGARNSIDPRYNNKILRKAMKTVNNPMKEHSQRPNKSFQKNNHATQKFNPATVRYKVKIQTPVIKRSFFGRKKVVYTERIVFVDGETYLQMAGEQGVRLAKGELEEKMEVIDIVYS